MIRITSFILSLLVLNSMLLQSCTQKGQPSTNKLNLSSDSILALAEAAYVFAYPLVLMEATRKVSTNFEKPVPGRAFAPMNQFGHFQSFPDANFKEIVKPNCDTYYSSAWLDLKNEPMILQVPNTNGRYYLLPMLDAYTNIFSSPGKRTTGTDAKTFIITGPNYKGSIPSQMTHITAPTNTVWILGRTQTNSASDGATIVKRIQEGFVLTPMSKFGTSYTPEKQQIDTTVSKTPPPLWVEQMDIASFFKLANQLMADNPPAKADESLLNLIAQLGIAPGASFSMDAFDKATQEKLATIPARVHAKLRDAFTKAGKLENGWNITRSGVGSYGTNYGQRALIALIGLGANLNEDACYPNCKIDGSGQKLNGKYAYVMHFEKDQLPPVHAFWSITMYGPDELLVANPINRYAIGDRDKLTFNPDGSLDIYIQHNSPGKDKEANWLPAGKDEFSLTMRLYWPKQTFFDGSWKMPAVTRIQ